MSNYEVLLLESFYGGSHKQLVDLLESAIPSCLLHTQSPKKWHWRARTGALNFAFQLPKFNNLKFLFTSCIFNLAELLALRPDLGKAKKILYFHENQLIYPTQVLKERDFQFGYNQILSCLVADEIFFNSHFNLDSFLGNIDKFFRKMPDSRPQGLHQIIQTKSKVLYFPIDFSSFFPSHLSSNPKQPPLKIVWPHRWEHDKNPELFLKILSSLKNLKLNFHVFILGQKFVDCSVSQEETLKQLSNHIKHFGFVEKREDYLGILCNCHLVLSTSIHEFFGVSMLEAAYCGSFPLCPKNLVYPEIFPDECLYKNEKELIQTLKSFCLEPSLTQNIRSKIRFEKYDWATLKNSYLNIFS